MGKQTDDLKKKLQNVVDTECEYADKEGSSRLSTCSHRHWDKNVWNHRSQIIQAIKDRGYIVSQSTNHGVLDIVTTQDI